MHHKLVAWFPESQVTLSFSADGWFTPPSSSSTEAFLPAGKGVVSDTYIECCRQGENQGVPGFSTYDAIPRKDCILSAMKGELTLTHGILTSPVRVWFRGRSRDLANPLCSSNYNFSFLSPSPRCPSWSLLPTWWAFIAPRHAVLIGHVGIRTLVATASWSDLN